MRRSARHHVLGALAAATVVAAPARAQQPTFTDSMLDKFVGDWTLQGMMQGKETTHDIAVRWAIQHQYLRIVETSREKKPDGTPTYEANVYLAWDGVAKQYTCVWLDTYGSVTEESIGRAPAGGKELAFVFHYRDGTGFHTTFTPGPTADTWTWKMDNVSKSGALAPFARVTLTRKPAPVPTR